MATLYFFEDLRVPLLDKLFSVLTYLGSEAVVLMFVLAAFWCVDKRFARLVLYSSLFSLGLNILLKNIFCVARPWVKDTSFTIVESARAGATGYSFPSGHTANSVTVYGCIGAYYKKPAMWAISLFAIAIVAFSRLYLGVHTLLDVSVSLALSSVILLVVYWAYEKSLRSRPARIVLDAVCVAFAFGVLLYLALAPMPDRADAELTAEGVKNAYSSFGAVVAFVIAINVDDRFIRYKTDGVWWSQILKFVIGALLVLAVKELLKDPLNALFNYSNIAHAVRYFLMVIVGGCLWPMTFGFWSRLGKNKTNMPEKLKG